ncbi:hypothetical protein I7X12_07840 [Halosimplex litoreum]|uniref:Uncharacterized protein n=1 Tax=Halosimplex litoreum TaxID=1198301 RepID=A0A7T3KWN4_9EURY|nr:hypothetical protein [Halosimplex litoreum]QPV64512.1 hypothetical protein I7X12_07840 [Halosimplex litoreum]
MFIVALSLVVGFVVGLDAAGDDAGVEVIYEDYGVAVYCEETGEVVEGSSSGPLNESEWELFADKVCEDGDSR